MIPLPSAATASAIPPKTAAIPPLPSLFLIRSRPKLFLSLFSTFRPLRPTLVTTASRTPQPHTSGGGDWGRSDRVSAASAASSAEVDMVRGRDGVWSAEQREKKVVVLWDLDNKPPRGPPYEAAMSLRRVAGLFGRVVDVSAYANRHAFVHLPQWVLEQRRDRRQLDALERKGVSVPSDPYVCGVCGRKCRTNLDLKKHFRQLHERERQKKLARMRSLKGKKRRRYKERFVSGNTKYEEAARELLSPRVGYGLAAELRRAGVFVRTVTDKPQAADAALKRQVQHSMARGIDCLFMVSDDSDFCDMVRRARESDLWTVVVGDVRTALSRQADLWVPWMGVENGEVDEEVLFPGGGADGDGVQSSFSTAHSYQDGDWSELDDVVDEIVVGNSGFRGIRISAFSEEEVVGMEDVRDGEGLDDDDYFRIYGNSLHGDELFWGSEDEEDEYF